MLWNVSKQEKAAQHINVPKSTVGDRVIAKGDMEVELGRKQALPLGLDIEK